eukprot:g30161.t1
MGTHMGPSYACLFVGYVEQSLFSTYTGTVPQLFCHYSDGYIGAASCTQAELMQFINFANNFDPILKFTCLHIQYIILKHFRQLQLDPTTRNIFHSPPLSAFRKDHSLCYSL